MSVLYCTIPHFAAALARRDDPGLTGRPLVLVGPEGQVWGVSAEAAACGVAAGMPVRTAEVRCPEAHLLDAGTARCRTEAEALLQVLEEASSQVEPHGQGSAYVDLEDLARDRADAVALVQGVGQAVRRALGDALQPALGWDSSKFTAQAAARRTQPGRLRAVDGMRQRAFLRPLPVTLLPLAGDTLQRLGFLGLRTLGQYGALPRAAVWQQFGRAGVLAHRCARGEDDRPVVPRWQAPQLASRVEFEVPLVERERLVTALAHLVSPLLAQLRENLQACGQVRLAVQFDDGSEQERERTFLLPVSQEERMVRALDRLLDSLKWPSAATALTVHLGQIQDTAAEQLTLFPLENEAETRIHEVQRYLATRFRTPEAVPCLRRAALVQPGAPLPEWRVGWLDEGAP